MATTPARPAPGDGRPAGPAEPTVVRDVAEGNGRPSTDAPPGGIPPPRPPLYRRPRVVVAAAVLIAIAVIAAIVYHRYASVRESTDDAFIDGDIIPVSPRVTGHIERVAVDDNQLVRDGDLLVQIDDRQYRASLDEAQAQLRAAQADASRLDRDARRARELFARQLIARADLDHAVTAARAADAQVEAARQRVADARLLLSFTTIRAPEAGRVTRKTAQEGQFVQVGQNLMAIVPQRFWVTANFKETQLTHMRPGQPVEIEVDAYPGLVLHGHVDSIQSGTGSRFSVLPPENASGNFVKVVQRVPVKIVFDEPPDARYPLGPGMSAVPTVRIG